MALIHIPTPGGRDGTGSIELGPIAVDHSMQDASAIRWTSMGQLLARGLAR